jgi:dCTP deaminase
VKARIGGTGKGYRRPAGGRRPAQGADEPPAAGGRLAAAVVLSDRTIREQISAGRLVIDPFDDTLVQPSSVDVRVAGEFRVFHNNRRPLIDVRAPTEDLTELVAVEDGGRFILHPGEFVLASTVERVAIPDDLVARLEGKSSLGRLGLLIHSTAGYIDPGFSGTITLELSNVARLPIAIYPGMPVGQISFLQMTTPVDAPYRGKYAGQRGPTASRYHQNTNY